MRLIHTHTIASAYTTTLSGIYTNEILPYVTFSQYNKICVCVFENNTTTMTGKLNAVFFSLAANPNGIASNAKNGCMIRSDYAEIRSFDLTNDARCSSGTVLKIYEVTI